ncbi:unnamed protein product [Clonostachys rhizophaga]|uniref:Major facilitator superfamily (MFS) profile domain-containing protein n=1 Tax=Clonostachys rhizophaga TaxID=160324 RepID=A0A9N9YI91_9HYPO|nr:unnamed protein product [Clonostachys rhizophaga]
MGISKEDDARVPLLFNEPIDANHESWAAAMAKSGQNDPEPLRIRERLSHFNGMLLFVMIYMAFCALNFGYDVGTFGGVQGMQSFTTMFGQRDPNTGLYVLPGWLSSVMTATPFLGKALGCICAGALAERWGRRAAVLGLCISSIVGALLQVSAHSATQFTVGRVITFTMTGMAIVVVPIYQAETAPKVLRGMFTSTIQLMIVLGQLIATLVTYGTQDIPEPRGWQIPVGLQLIIPVVILAFLPLLPESPRWLLSRGRKGDALRSLTKLRGSASEGEVSKEIEAIEYARANEQQGSWSDVFSDKHRVRTMVAVLVMFGQQITGQAFPSQYGVVFYLSQGFGSQAFLFNVISNIIALAAVVITLFHVDSVGRRPVLLVGGAFMGAFLFILGGMGTLVSSTMNVHERNVIVASLMMFSFFFNLSWAPISYVVVSETAALCVKEKTNLLACVVSVLTTFITSFTCPYLINPQYAGLGSKVGFVYGSFAFAMVGLAYFLIPELKGRTLEEVDQLFESKVPLRKFGGVRTMTAEELYQGDLAPRGRGIGGGKLHDNER